MAWQWTPYAIPLALATLISAGLAAYGTARLRSDRSALVGGFVLTMIGGATWSGLYLLQLSATTLDAKLLFMNLNVGKNVAVLGFLVFALAFTGNERFLRPRWLAVAASWPAVFYLLVRPTWEYHDLYVSNPAVWPLEGHRRIGMTAGIANDVDAAWAYLVLFVGMALVARFGYRKHGVYRRQAGLIVGAALVPTVLNIPVMGGIWGFIPVSWPWGFNPSPIAMTVTGVLLAVAIFRYQFMDIVPVARDRVIDTMRDGYLVIDEQERVIDLNPAARDLLDVDGDPLGKRIDELLPDEELVNRRRTDDRLHGTFEVGQGSDTRYVEGDLSPLSQDDQFLGRLVTLRDVTERRSVERRYQALIEHSSDLITVVDADGTVQYQSPSAQRVLGVAPSEMADEPVFSFVHPDERAAVREEFHRVIREGEDFGPTEIRVQTAFDEYRIIEAVGRNLLEDPFVEGLVINSRDVTERIEREEKLRRKNERLDQFASLVSHDLRNPLSVAKGRTELAVETDPETHLPHVERSLERMEAIIDDVLTLARQGDEVGETTTVDLATRAREAWQNVDTETAELVVEDSLELSADPDRLLQLFENLYRNAIEHGGRDVTVTVIAAENGFAVEDDGPGIPPGDRESVFESGYTTADDGTGFGLAIVERIAEGHGWSVRVGTGRDGGARFEVSGVESVVATETADD